VKKSAAAIPKRGTVLLCTGHHARIFPTPIPASTSRRPRDHSSLLRPSQTRRSLTRDALDCASADAERLGNFQDTHALRKLLSNLPFRRTVYLRPAEFHALRYGALETCFDPLTDHRPLKLSKGAC
jgi:hypothetical protein